MLAQNETNRLEAVENRLSNAEADNSALRKENAEITQRMMALEKRVFGHNRHRWDAVEKAADYFMGAQVPGDYAEFGVYRGETFVHACQIMAPRFEDMHFWAFDSFEGLPQPQDGLDRHDGYSGGFFKGQFACSQSGFRENLEAGKVDLSRVSLVPGWYSETLRQDHAVSAKLQKIAFAWVDCDLYESTVPVLNFMTNRLSVGTIILFDDWRCFRNLSEYGQQKACLEWLEQNPQIKLLPMFDFGYHGFGFSVAAC